MATTATHTNPDAARAGRIATGSPAEGTVPDRTTVVLANGKAVPVRPIRPSDAAALRRFHRCLSEQTVYQRFFAPLPELSEEQARYFACVDGRQRFALVALDPDRPNELVAVVRFDRDPGSDRAEFAAVVADRWQGRRLGRAMTRRLMAAARTRGVRWLYAFVLPGNARMLGLLGSLGMPVRTCFADGVDRVELDLAGLPERGSDVATGRLEPQMASWSAVAPMLPATQTVAAR